MSFWIILMGVIGGITGLGILLGITFYQLENQQVWKQLSEPDDPEK